MLGAIIGDIVGSRWEFNPTNDYDFEWLSKENGFTDDTICTVAIVGSIAEAIWGIPESMKTEIMAYLPDEMKAVVKEFYEYIK